MKMFQVSTLQALPMMKLKLLSREKENSYGRIK